MRFITRAIIFLLPVQLGYHFWPNWAYIYGIRVDYFAPTIYLTDVLIMVFVVGFLFKTHFLSKTHFLFKNKKRVLKLLKQKVRVLLLVLIFVLFNCVLASAPLLSAVKWFKLLELGLFGFFVANLNFHKRSDIVLPLALSLIIISLIGITQFVSGRSLGGIYYFLGERSFTLSTPGIALGEVGGKVFLRPYSIFSHPNSFAGYLLVSLTLLWVIRKENNKIANIVALTTSGFALVLAYSLSAYIGILFILGVILAAYLSENRKQIHPMIITMPFITNNSEIYERIKLAEASLQLFKRSPLFGIGLNNFVSVLPTADIDSAVIWKLQPVHNIFLLVLSELGIVGLAGFIYLIYKSIKSCMKYNQLLILPLLAILLTGMFDHYWLTLQQNQLLFALVVGLSFNKNVYRNKLRYIPLRLL